MREKQRKMEQLEKCMGTNKGLKIAGISTLGLTAAGVAANIYEAKAIKDNEKTIEKKNEKIESINAEIARKQEAKNKQKDVVEEAHVTPEVNTDFKTLCEGESFNGTFNVNAVPKEQTSGTGQVVEINVPVLAACTLSGENNTEDKCKELVQKCANPRAYHYNSGTGVCACLGDAEAKCLNGEEVCYDTHDHEQETNTILTNKTAQDLQTCKTKVRFAGGQKWSFGKAVENNFRDMASSYELAVEDDTEIYNSHKTMVYQEIFATKKQEIDAFVIPNEQGHSWSCNGITINSDSCAGKTYKECFNPFYECRLDNAKMLAEREAENKYIEALTQSICYVKSL